MKLFVNNLILILFLTLFLCGQAAAQSMCECVECPKDEVACCRYESGQCKGKCIRIKSGRSFGDVFAKITGDIVGSIAGIVGVDSKSKSDDYFEETTRLLSYVVNKKVTENELVESSEKFLPIIELILANSDGSGNKPSIIEFNFENKKIKIAVSLNDYSKRALLTTKEYLKKVPSKSSLEPLPKPPAPVSFLLDGKLEKYRNEQEDFRENVEYLRQEGKLGDKEYKYLIAQYFQGLYKYQQALKETKLRKI